MVSTRPEFEAAQNEYESFLSQSGLRREDLHHVLLEDVEDAVVVARYIRRMNRPKKSGGITVCERIFP